MVGMAQTGYIIIPASAADKLAELGRAMLKIAEGMKLEAHTSARVKPRHVPKDQEWFWTPEWQAMERAADKALAGGDYQEFKIADDAITYLHSRV